MKYNIVIHTWVTSLECWQKNDYPSKRFRCERKRVEAEDIDFTATIDKQPSIIIWNNMEGMRSAIVERHSDCCRIFQEEMSSEALL